MSITIKQIETFAAVADLGSFSRAAERLSTTQPNVSSRIASLEAALGGPVMTRDTAALRLTELGERTLPLARAMLASRDDMITAAASPHLYEGAIRLGVTEVIAATWLSQLLDALHTRFPNVLVELTVGLSSDLSTALRNRELDLALQNGPFHESLSGVIPLDRCDMVWVARADQAFSHGVMDHTTLRQHPILTHARGSGPHQQLTAYFEQHTGRRPRIVPSSNLSVCIELLLNGYGIACLPRPLVAAHLQAGEMVALRCDWTPDDLEFAARFERDVVPGYVVSAAEIARDVALDNAAVQ